MVQVKGVKAATMRKKRQTKVNVLLCTVAVLLCATLYSTHLVGGLYARYTTSGSSNDSARVAAFNIEEEGTLFQTVQAEIKPGSTAAQNVDLIINNKSEVAVQCDIQVTNVTGNLPEMEFTLGPKLEDEKPEADTPAVTLESEDSGASASTIQISAGGKAKYLLNISWTPNEEKPEEDLALMGMVDYVTIAVTATQID